MSELHIHFGHHVVPPILAIDFYFFSRLTTNLLSGWWLFPICTVREEGGFLSIRLPNFKISHCLENKHANLDGTLSWNLVCTSNGREDFQHEILDQPTLIF